jgi:hypothetical protein
MPFIGTRMNGNAFGTESLEVNSTFQKIREISAPRIAKGSDLIDIYR